MSNIENNLAFEEDMIMADIENHLEMRKGTGIQYKNIFFNGKEYNNFKKYLDPEKSVTLNIFISNEEFETITQKEDFINYIYEKYGEDRDLSRYNGYFDGFENSNGEQLFLLAREDQKKKDLKGNDLQDSIRLTLAHEFMHVKQWSNSLLPLKKTTKWKFNILKLKPNWLAKLLYAMNFKELAANIYAIKYAAKHRFDFDRMLEKIVESILLLGALSSMIALNIINLVACLLVAVVTVLLIGLVTVLLVGVKRCLPALFRIFRQMIFKKL